MMSMRKSRSTTGHVLLPATNEHAGDSHNPLLVHEDIGSWTIGRGTVIWRIWPTVLLHTGFAAFVTSVSLCTTLNLAVPPVLFTVLGVVIGFVISYRASSGYERYWTGRCSWSDIIKTSRTMSRLVWFHIPLKDEKDAPSVDLANAKKCMREKRLALDMIEGFAVAVKHHLRGETGIYYEDLYHLVKPLHDHSHRQRDLQQSSKRRDEEPVNGLSSAMKISSPIASTRDIGSFSPDPIIPAVNEYGTFRSSSCSTADESERPFLFPSMPRRPSSSRVLTELIPFSSFFSSIGSTVGHRKSRTAEFFPQFQEDDDADGEQAKLRRRYLGSRGRKFRPLVPGGGRNIPLEVLRCLSEWLSVLDERGVVSGSPLGGMYGCITTFEDSLSTLERILTTPIPFVYSAHIRQCVWLYLFILPFQLVGQFGWYTIPGVAIGAFFYIGFLAAGEEIEQPFGYDENDLDLDLFCHKYIHAEIEALKRMGCANSLSELTENADGNALPYPSRIEHLATNAVSGQLPGLQY